MNLRIAIAAVVGFTVGMAASPNHYDPMLQSNFPCNEDEVLMFHQRFGSERVGCIAIDELVLTTELWPTPPPLELPQ